MNKHIKNFKLEIDSAVKKLIYCKNVEGCEQAAAVNAAIGYFKKLLEVNEMPCFYRYEDEDILQKVDYKE
jgi:hypothetical protein